MQNFGIEEIEPFEAFLSLVICRDRLMMYQRAIDVIKITENTSALESAQSILNNASDESPSELESLIYDSLTNSLKEIIAKFDVIVNRSSLVFLVDLLEVLYVLDAYEEHETICNVINSGEGSIVNRLYALCCHIRHFDEEEFKQTVIMCSQSLLDKVLEVHSIALESLEANTPPSDVIVNSALIKRMISENPDLIVRRMIDDHQIIRPLPAHILTAVAAPYFTEYNQTDPMYIARDLVALYMTTGLDDQALIQVIKDNISSLIGDDSLVGSITALLTTMLVRLKQ